MNCVEIQNVNSAEQLIKSCLIHFYRTKKNNHVDDIHEEAILRCSMLKMEATFDYAHRDMVIREITYAMKCCGFRANYTHQTIAMVTGLSVDTVKMIAGNKKIKEYASVRKQ